MNTLANRYMYLLIGLVGYLILLPIVSHLEGRVFTIAADFSALIILVAGVWSFGGMRGRRAVAWSLLAVAFALRLLSTLGDSSTLYLLSTVPVLLFCLLFSGIALKDVLFGGRIDVNRLMGAVCVYLLLGIIWALLYVLLQGVVPGSFALLEGSGNAQEFEHLVYFSFVTLTTLGYGDLSPGVPIARTLAYLEAAFGQLYLTILVAALVGMLLSPGESVAAHGVRSRGRAGHAV